MSYYAENVIWQSPDGTWNRGFFEDLGCGGCDDDDETHEWCREFDYNRFDWVSCGHPSEEDAARSWNGSNPGGHDLVRYDPEHAEWTAKYEDMAAVKYEEAQADQERARASSRGYYSYGHGYGYSGPPKQRSLAAMQADRDARVQAWIGHRLGGYANLLDEDKKASLDAKIAARLMTASPAEVAVYEERDAAHRDTLRQMLADHRTRRREQARYHRGYYNPQAAQHSRMLNEREDEVEALIAQADAAATLRAHQRQPKVKKIVEHAAGKPATDTSAAKKPPAPKVAKKTAAPAAQARQPRGVPTGGQFAATARAEATVDLSASTPAADPVTDDPATWGDDPWA